MMTPVRVRGASAKAFGAEGDDPDGPPWKAFGAEGDDPVRPARLPRPASDAAGVRTEWLPAPSPVAGERPGVLVSSSAGRPLPVVEPASSSCRARPKSTTRTA